MLCKQIAHQTTLQIGSTKPDSQITVIKSQYNNLIVQQDAVRRVWSQKSMFEQ